MALALLLQAWSPARAATRLDFPVRDLLVNGSFTDSLDGWSFEATEEFPRIWVGLGASEDLDSGALESGKLFLEPATATVASQCVTNIAAGLTYGYGGLVKEVIGGPFDGVLIEVFWHQQEDCAGPALFSSRLDGAPHSDWFALRGETAAPPKARSARIALRLRTPTGGQLIGGWDQIFFGLPDAPCVSTADTLCLHQRFAVKVSYTTSQGPSSSGQGHAVDLSAFGLTQGGVFWLFDSSNPEILVKVLDACEAYDHYWVFVAAGTNVGFSLQVTDLEQHRTWRTDNVDGELFTTAQDFSAFPCS